MAQMPGRKRLGTNRRRGRISRERHRILRERPGISRECAGIPRELFRISRGRSGIFREQSGILREWSGRMRGRAGISWARSGRKRESFGILRGPAGTCRRGAGPRFQKKRRRFPAGETFGHMTTPLNRNQRFCEERRLSNTAHFLPCRNASGAGVFRRDHFSCAGKSGKGKPVRSETQTVKREK